MNIFDGNMTRFPGPGDECTWPPCAGDPGDPRTPDEPDEYDDDENINEEEYDDERRIYR